MRIWCEFDCYCKFDEREEINYQQNAYFVAQDIDPLVAKMCYIQLSLLGCPGVVIIGNTLEGEQAKESTGIHLFILYLA